MSEWVMGADLRVGDTIEVWWQPNRDTIKKLVPYKGPLEKHFMHGAQLADFAISRIGSTIENGGLYHRIARAPIPVELSIKGKA